MGQRRCLGACPGTYMVEGGEHVRDGGSRATGGGCRGSGGPGQRAWGPKGGAPHFQHGAVEDGELGGAGARSLVQPLGGSRVGLNYPNLRSQAPSPLS